MTRGVRRSNERRIPHHMDNPGRENEKLNRIHLDQCEIQGRCPKSKQQHISARRHEPKSTKPSPEDAALLQRSEEIQDSDTAGHGESNRI